jgi:hypothetical protein
MQDADILLSNFPWSILPVRLTPGGRSEFLGTTVQTLHTSNSLNQTNETDRSGGYEMQKIFPETNGLGRIAVIIATALLSFMLGIVVGRNSNTVPAKDLLSTQQESTYGRFGRVAPGDVHH